MREIQTIFKKQMLVVILCSVLLATSTVAIKPDSNKNNQIDKPLEIIINNLDFKYATIQTNLGSFADIEVTGEGLTTDIGKAKLPMIRRLIEIPYGSEPEIIVKSISWKTTSLKELNLPDRIIPLQPSAQKNDKPSDDIIIDEYYYSTNEYTPKDAATVSVIGYIRSHCIAQVEIPGVQYNPATGELKLLVTCELMINLKNGDIQKTIEDNERYASSSFEPMIKTMIINYDSYNPDTRISKNPEGYLIIVYDSFYNQILPLANWKQNNGYEVTVTRTSQIPGGATAQNIKNYISNAYYNWPTPPSYVLLVGDTDQIPTWTGSATGTCTDLYYVTITTPDYFPDIYIGRFPATTTTHVTTMVDKTLSYLNGNYPSGFLTKTVFMASSDNYQISEGTHNYVISMYLEPNNYLFDKLYYYRGATTQQVKDSLNNGRVLAVYSGHGSTTSWSDGPPFSQSDINSLNNANKYPFICSHACLTNQFTVSECFGETWLRAQNKGGMVFWGSSDYTYWDEDDVLEKKMFQAWWTDNLETIGGMTDRALYYLYQYYGGGGRSQYYFEAYNVLGDPSISIPAVHYTPQNDVGVTSIVTPGNTTYSGAQTVTAIVRNYGTVNQTQVPVRCEINRYVYTQDFENNNGNYNAGGSPSTLWQWGTPTSGPGSAHSGTRVWGTNLAGQYPNNANSYLTSPLIQLPQGIPITLSFWHWYQMESYYDGGNVKISVNGGASWSILGSYLNPYPEDAASSTNAGIPNQPCFSGSNGGWQQVSFDLSSYAGQQVLLRWHFGSDGSITYPGWYIDDVTIEASGSVIYTSNITTSVNALSNVTISFTPQWIAEAGTYKITAYTLLPSDERPNNDRVEKIVVVLPNSPPMQPMQPYGPVNAIVGVSYQYTTQTIDPDGDQVYYMFDWGNGSYSGWLGPYQSGVNVTVSHSWPSRGIYQVKVKAKDTNNAESIWSSVLNVRVCRLGDVNNDGLVTLADIDPFVLALVLGEQEFTSQYPNWCWHAADCNLDGMVTLADVDPFVVLLVGG